MIHWNDDKLLKIAQEVQDALRDCAFDLQNKSVMQAPIDTSAMRHSCKVNHSKAFEYEVYYDASAPCYSEYYYALRQHEDLSLNHLMGTNAKFLEKPMNERIGIYEFWISLAISEGCNSDTSDRVKIGME